MQGPCEPPLHTPTDIHTHTHTHTHTQHHVPDLSSLLHLLHPPADTLESGLDAGLVGGGGGGG
jgi:hypothetical protein